MSAKPDTQDLKNAYTDAPELHPKLLQASLQLFFWLFFHPSAWRSQIACIEPDLRPNFCLAELRRAHWPSSELRRLLVIGHIVLPLLTGLLTGVMLWILGESAITIAVGVLGGATFAAVVIVSSGLSIGFAPAIAGGVTGALAAGVGGGLAGAMALVTAVVVAYKMPGSLTLDTAAEIVKGDVAVAAVVAIVAMTGGLGILGSVAGSITGRVSDYSLARRLGGAAIGVLIAILVYVVTLGLAFVLVGAEAGVLTFGVAGIAQTGVAGGVAVGSRTHDWKRGLAFGVGLGIVWGVAFGVGVNVADMVVAEVAVGLAFGLVGVGAISVAFVVAGSTYIALPYVLAERIADPWAGAVAGVLGAGGALMIFWSVLVGYPLGLRASAIGFACALLGLTQVWWRPVLLYPAVMAWNTLLYYADQPRATDRPSLLRWHSAFWDEEQRLRLSGLDDHLVLVAERNLAEGQAAIEYLATGRQRWAAQAAQIELDARGLERCAGVEAIGQEHQELAAGELAGPASALLRTFSRLSQDVEAALGQESTYNQRLAFSAIEDRLDGLLRELTRSSERYALRFRPVARQWRQIVADHVHYLVETVEQRQEIDNPYVIGVPLTEQQEIFVGRTDIGARIEGLLLDRRRAPLLLYGQRRTGKTSLLNNLGRLLPSTIVPLFVDLQGPASRAKDHAGFLYNLARGMIDSAGRGRGLVLPPLSHERLATDPFTRFDEWLDQVEKALAGSTALLALDEFETMERAFERGRFEEESVLGMLRHLIQHRSCFKVLLTGSHTLDEVHRWASYLINVQLVHISYLKEDEARQLIERPVKDFALRYQPEASQRVLDLTRGHPALVQLLCAEIVALKNEQEPAVRRLARLIDVEAAVPEALSSGSFYFADIERNQVDAAGLELLRFLAAQGEGAIVSQEALPRQLPDPGDLDQALALLTRRELIEAVDGGHVFQVELIRRWFAR